MPDSIFKTLPIKCVNEWYEVPMVVDLDQHTMHNVMMYLDVERKVKLWLAENTINQQVVLGGSVCFKDESEAALFYLSFQSGVTIQDG